MTDLMESAMQSKAKQPKPPASIWYPRLSKQYPIPRDDIAMISVGKICDDLGIRLASKNGTCGPFQTKAGRVLREIYLAHGEGHLILTLRSIIESENNAAEIREFTIRAVSDLILAHPDWANSGLKWLEAFDRIGLFELRKEVRANRYAVSQRQGMATLIYRELLDFFNPPKSSKSGHADDEMAEDDLVYGLDGIAEFLGVRMCHVKTMIRDNVIKPFCMPGLSTRCARKSELAAIVSGCKEAARRTKRKARSSKPR